MRKTVLLICLLATVALAFAQDAPKPATPPPPDAPKAMAAPQENPFTAFDKRAFGQLKIWLVRSAEKMPEESYSFKPTEAVRSFGQIVGHVADAQYLFCSAVLGEKNPAPKIERSKTSKADLIAALQAAFAYCDKAYDGMSDAAGTQTVKLFGNDMAKLNVLTAHNMHNSEHYGNIVTYLRMKNIVPPSTEQASQARPQPKK